MDNITRRYLREFIYAMIAYNLTLSLSLISRGFIENAGFPPVSLRWVFPVMILLWGPGLAFISRRYQ